MMKRYLLALAYFLFAQNAQAEFMVDTQIVEFKSADVLQQDVELTSRDEATQYINAEVSVIEKPGSKDEKRVPVDDPETGGLLVTPNKMILAPNGKQLMRFVLLQKPADKERIYRVTLKPISSGVETDSKLGLKILVGYEVLVIVRPSEVKPNYTYKRNGKTLTVTNNGNSNVLMQNGRQCEPGKKDEECKFPPVTRIYPGTTVDIILPLDDKVSYSAWDGVKTRELRVD